MGARKIEGNSQVVSFCSGMAFRRDDLIDLHQAGLLAPFDTAADARPALDAEVVSVEGVSMRVEHRPFSERERKEALWRRLAEQSRAAALPQRFSVRLPLAVEAANASPGAPRVRALACECLVSALGVGVEIRLSCDPTARERLVSWPGRERVLVVRGPGGGVVWRGDLAEVLWLVARAALARLGAPWIQRAGERWKEALGAGGKRVYAEILDTSLPGRAMPDERLEIGLASQLVDYASLTRAELARRRYRMAGDRVRRTGEVQVFAPRGAALFLLYRPDDENLSWRGANCHRRDVVYSLVLHGMLVDLLRTLETEAGAGPESTGVRLNERVRAAARLRVAVLNDLYDAYPWVRHYSRLQLSPDALDALPADVKEHLGASPFAGLVSRLRKDPSSADAVPAGAGAATP